MVPLRTLTSKLVFVGALAIKSLIEVTTGEEDALTRTR
jgi:hypothetical protein